MDINNNKIGISIIIPTYNNSQTINKALDSVLDSKYDTLQIIVVDDGSQDGTSTLVKKYQEKFSCVEYIYQENHGVSVARNVGLQKSNKEYVMFLDSDDSLLKDGLNRVFATLENQRSDLYVFDYISKIDESSIYHKMHLTSGKVSQQELVSAFLKTDDLNASWGKVFSRELLVDNAIEFPAGVKVGEDAIFNEKVLSCISWATYIPKPLVLYDENESTATKKPIDSFDDQEKLFHAKTEIAEKFPKLQLREEFYTKYLGDFLANLSNCPSSNFFSLCKEIGRYSFIKELLNYGYSNLSKRRKMQILLIKSKNWQLLYLELKLESLAHKIK